jgi:hypothetical protein
MDLNKVINDLIDDKLNTKIENLKNEIELELLLRMKRDYGNIIEKNKDYKIALCLSGHVRSFLKPYYAIKKYLLDKYDVDIFIHTWSYDGQLCYAQDVSGNLKKIIENKTRIDEETLTLLYNPKKISIEDQTANSFMSNVPKRIKSNYYKAKGPVMNNFNAWCQMYSISFANQLKMQYEKDNDFEYDFVIRMRFDHILDQFKHEWFDFRKAVKFTDAFWIAPNKINDKLADLFNYYYNVFIVVKMFNVDLYYDYLFKKLKLDEEIEEIINLNCILIKRKDKEELIFEKKK